MRELENCIKRAVIMADDNQITLEDIGLSEEKGGEVTILGCAWRVRMPSDA